MVRDDDDHCIVEMLPSILPLLALNKRRLQVSIQDANQHTLKNISYGGLEELWMELDACTKCDSEVGS